MKHRGSSGEGSHETDPFRKMKHTDEEDENLPPEEAFAIKEMKEKIAKEKKPVFSIRLSEGIKIYDPIPLFEEALRDQDEFKPEGIILYSLATGILRYTGDEVFSPKAKSFYYSNPDEPSVTLDIYVNKNDKERPYPHVFSLTTKAKVEHDKKINQEMKKQAPPNSLEQKEESLSTTPDHLKPKKPKKPNTIK